MSSLISKSIRVQQLRLTGRRNQSFRRPARLRYLQGTCGCILNVVWQQDDQAELPALVGKLQHLVLGVF